MIVLACLLFSAAVFAQDPHPAKTSDSTFEMNTIFGKGKKHCDIAIGYFMEIGRAHV